MESLSSITRFEQNAQDLVNWTVLMLDFGTVEALCVRDAHILPAYIVELSERLDNVLIYMANNHMDCALVERYGKLVWIFTVTDICKAYGHLLREHFDIDDESGGDDAA